MRLFIVFLLLHSVSNLVFGVIEGTSQSNELTKWMNVTEGVNVTLDCAFNHSVTCSWKKKKNILCIDNERFRFVHKSHNEKQCPNASDNDCDDCSKWFQYNDCSIYIFNYTNSDSEYYECTGALPESGKHEGEIGGRFQLITNVIRSNNDSDSNSETNNSWVYVCVAVGGALLLLVAIFAITGVCVMKKRKKNFSHSEGQVAIESANQNESSSANVTLDTSGLSEEALVQARKPQPNPRSGLGSKRKSASTGCINPYAQINLSGSTTPLHAANSALTSGYSVHECYSNLYDDVAFDRKHLYEIVPPSSTQYDDNHYALPVINKAQFQKSPPNSEVVYAEIQITHKGRRLKPSKKS